MTGAWRVVDCSCFQPVGSSHPTTPPNPLLPLPGNAQKQGRGPEGRAERPPRGRAQGDEMGVSSPGHMLTGVVELVSQVAQYRHEAHKGILVLWATPR